MRLKAGCCDSERSAIMTHAQARDEVSSGAATQNKRTPRGRSGVHVAPSDSRQSASGKAKNHSRGRQSASCEWRHACSASENTSTACVAQRRSTLTVLHLHEYRGLRSAVKAQRRTTLTSLRNSLKNSKLGIPISRKAAAHRYGSLTWRASSIDG